MSKKNTKALAIILAAATVLLLAGVALVLVVLFNSKYSSRDVSVSREQVTSEIQSGFNIEGGSSHLQNVDDGDCDEPNPVFPSFVTDLDKVTNITPPLMRVSGDVKTHSYINVTEQVPIYAPVAATLVSGAKYMAPGREEPQHSLNFTVNCRISFYIDHLIDPIPEIAARLSEEPNNDTHSVSIEPLEVKAGQLLGYSPESGQHNWDFGVLDYAQTTILASDPQFNQSEKYRHATCPLNFFTEEVQAQTRPLLSYEGHSDLQVIDNLCD